MEVAELLDLVRVRPVAVGARDLQNRGQPLQLGVAEEDAHALGDLSLAQVRVAVAVGAQRCSGVVHMQRSQAVEADALLDLVQASVQRRAIRDIGARDPEVARVEADAKPRVPVEAVYEDRQLVDRAADRPAGSGGVLDQEPGRLGAALERALERRHDVLETRLEAGAEV
jgi:hypothetical protein